MADAVDHNCVLSRLVEDQIWIWRDNHAPQARVAGQLAGMRMVQQQIDDDLNACLNMPGTLRRSLTDVVEHPVEFGSAAQGVAKSHR